CGDVDETDIRIYQLGIRIVRLFVQGLNLAELFLFLRESHLRDVTLCPIDFSNFFCFSVRLLLVAADNSWRFEVVDHHAVVSFDMLGIELEDSLCFTPEPPGETDLPEDTCLLSLLTHDLRERPVVLGILR